MKGSPLLPAEGTRRAAAMHEALGKAQTRGSAGNFTAKTSDFYFLIPLVFLMSEEALSFVHIFLQLQLQNSP